MRFESRGLRLAAHRGWPVRTSLAAVLVALPLAGASTQTANAQEASGGQAANGSAQGATGTGEAGVRSNVLEEVVVTAARKRSENVQTTPIAVTALNADLLTRNNVTNTNQIGDLVPNLEINRHGGVSGLADVYLRGFGTQLTDPTSDPHVATFLDGIYQPTTVGTEFDTFALDRIEVQAGPQGTLLGKNAPVGAIYITSERPTGEFKGAVEADYGSYDQYGVHAKFNLPLIVDPDGTSILATNFAYSQRGGGNWVHNIATNNNDFGGFNNKTFRAGVAFDPSESFSWVVHGMFALINDPWIGTTPRNNAPGVPGSISNAAQVQPFSCSLQQSSPLFAAILNNQGCMSLPFGQTDSLYTSHDKENLTEISSNMSYKLDPVTLTLVTGFISYWQVDRADTGGTPFVSVIDYGDRETYDEETAEFRISSNAGGGWDLDGILDWVVGGYFSNFQYAYNNHLGVGIIPGPSGIPFTVPTGVVNDNQYEQGRTQSEAVFAHVIGHLNDKWSATFGVRQSWDHKFQAAQATAETAFTSATPAGFHNVSFEVGTAYQFDADRMAYFRFAQGYEAGGFGSFQHPPTSGNIYQPELDDTYELGFKSDWLEKRLRVNADIFDNEISQLQLSGSVPTNTPPFYIQETLNAGSATIQGAELQVTAVPTEDITLFLNLGYLHPRYNKNQSTVCSNIPGVNEDCSGVPFVFAPKWTIRLGGDYVVDLPEDLGTATFSGSINYKTSHYTFDPPLPSSFQNEYATVDLSVTFRDPTEKYALKFYGTNITDRHYYIQFLNPGGIGSWATYDRPAEWGMSVNAKF